MSRPEHLAKSAIEKIADPEACCVAVRTYDRC